MDIKILLLPIIMFLIVVFMLALICFAPEHPFICGALFIAFLYFAYTGKNESDLF